MLYSNTPSLGACLIVRNGRSTIEAAIRSLLPFISQLVVVDTGSDDKTPSICARYGAELHFFAWTDNFSEARNYALRCMRTNWVITLDADETIDPASLGNFLPLPSTSTAGGFRVALHNALSTAPNGATSIHHYPRIFRRHPSIRYKGAIHEQIGDSIIEAGFGILDSPVIIHHHGYTTVSTQKIERNAGLLRTELAGDPQNPWLQYHLGLTEFAAQHYTEAQHYLLSALGTAALAPEQMEMASLRLAQMALGREDWTEFEKRISFIGSDVHREGFRQYLAAVRLLLSGKYRQALEFLSMDTVQLSSLVDREQLATVIQVCRQQTFGTQ
jgi:hypothetical protein